MFIAETKKRRGSSLRYISPQGMSAGIQADGIPNNLVRTSSGRSSRNSSRRSNPPASPTKAASSASGSEKHKRTGSKSKSKSGHEGPFVNTVSSKGSGKVNLGATTSGDLDDYEPDETDPLPTVREEINLCDFGSDSKRK